MNPAGVQDDREFVELLNTGGPASATNLWLLQINGNFAGDDGTNPGVIVAAWDLSDLSFGANGMLLIGDGYATPPYGGPYSNVVPLSCGFGDPAGFGGGDLLNFCHTWMLVSNLDAAATIGLDLDTDNDGTLDLTPWTNLLDSVGWKEKQTNGLVYSPASLFNVPTPSWPAASTPDGATRFPGDVTPNSSNAWYGGDVMITGLDLAGRLYMTNKCTANCPPDAYMTPGDANYPVDSDGDGMSDTYEAAYFGGPTNGVATDDPDADNHNNLNEYVADTDPTNSASFYPPITGPMPTGNVWTFTIIPSSPDRLYDIMWSTNLLAPGWNRYGFARRGNAGPLSLIVTNEGRVRFYRTAVRTTRP